MEIIHIYANLASKSPALKPLCSKQIILFT